MIRVRVPLPNHERLSPSPQVRGHRRLHGARVPVHRPGARPAAQRAVRPLRPARRGEDRRPARRAPLDGPFVSRLEGRSRAISRRARDAGQWSNRPGPRVTQMASANAFRAQSISGQPLFAHQDIGRLLLLRVRTAGAALRPRPLLRRNGSRYGADDIAGFFFRFHSSLVERFLDPQT